MKLPCPAPLLRLAVGVVALLVIVTAGHAAGLRYTDGLAPEAQIAAGLRRVSPAQLSALNDLIGRELALARAGDVRGFAGTFSGRRTAAERAAAGLDLLTEAERGRIDALVVTLLASPPATFWPSQTASPRDRGVEPVRERPRIHGSVTAMYGWGSGGYSTYGGSLSTHYYDPVRKFSAAVEISDYRTDHGNLPRYLTRERR
jgi:hypothetical protein